MSLNFFAFFRVAKRWSGAALILGAILGLPAFGQSMSEPATVLKDARNVVDLALAAQERLSVADTVRGILSYARWPDESHALRLCVIGSGAHGETLLNNGLNPLTQRPVTLLRVSIDADVVAQCDALYVGELDEDSWRTLFSRIAGKPVLTICERSPICMIGGMFCLDVHTNSAGVPFEVNLDSVARSGVRVNPQVLRLGRRTAKSSS